MGSEEKIPITSTSGSGCPQRGVITQGFGASFLSKPIPLAPFKDSSQKNEAREEPAAFHRFGRGDAWLERPRNVGLREAAGRVPGCILHA